MSALALTKGTVQTVMDAVLVADQAVVYSDPIIIENTGNAGIFIKIAGTTPHVKIVRVYNFSVQDVPESDKWAEVGVDGSTEDVVSADFESEDWTNDAQTLKASVWMKYKVTGLPANDDDTTVSIVVAKQAKIHRLE